MAGLTRLGVTTTPALKPLFESVARTSAASFLKSRNVRTTPDQGGAQPAIEESEAVPQGSFYPLARLSDTHEMLRQTCRDFADRELKPVAGMLDKVVRRFFHVCFIASDRRIYVYLFFF